MKIISLSKFFYDSEQVLGEIAKGESFVITRLRKPVARLTPVGKLDLGGGGDKSGPTKRRRKAAAGKTKRG